ncbi:MAG: FkbM family methyltransferase [Leptodesmis sp.]|uniref:FkbM family methyltransferase n=1 Tax=Leptodesmis sp. TaxID=3100501 RepID=UPI003CA01053
MRIFQEILLWIYQFFKKSGLLETGWFQYLFSVAYFSYKRYLEDPFWGLTKKYPELFKGGNILDIGANIGYTSCVFSKAITPNFRVYAFEPEEENFTTLKNTIKLHRVVNKVIPVQAAVGESSGEVELWYNETHHADHRILTERYKETGINLSRVSQIPMWSIDRFVELEIGQVPIKLIKIDVQGYELPVCLGMQQTLNNNPDLVIAVEYSPSSITDLGFRSEDLLNFFLERAYFMYSITQRGNLELIGNTNPDQLDSINRIVKRRGYIDLLFTQKQLSMS